LAPDHIEIKVTIFKLDRNVDINRALQAQCVPAYPLLCSCCLANEHCSTCGLCCKNVNCALLVLLQVTHNGLCHTDLHMRVSCLSLVP
jgi:hypothetical protein